MQMLSGASLRALVRSGVNLELDARQVAADLACDLVQIGGSSTFTFMSADHYPAAALERLAHLGNSRVTFRFNTSEVIGEKSV